MSVELLAPAGSLSKLKFAFMYGADAVYIGGERFSLRAAAGNFSFEEMCEGVSFAHQHAVKVYLADVSMFSVQLCVRATPATIGSRSNKFLIFDTTFIILDQFIVCHIQTYSRWGSD